MPRHQPEPYIRRRATPASSPRHTFSSFAFFCLFSFLFFSFYYVRTLCALVHHLGYGPRSIVSINLAPLGTTAVRVRCTVPRTAHGRTGHHTWCRVLSEFYCRGTTLNLGTNLGTIFIIAEVQHQTSAPASAPSLLSPRFYQHSLLLTSTLNLIHQHVSTLIVPRNTCQLFVRCACTATSSRQAPLR